MKKLHKYYCTKKIGPRRQAYLEKRISAFQTPIKNSSLDFLEEDLSLGSVINLIKENTIKLY